MPKKIRLVGVEILTICFLLLISLFPIRDKVTKSVEAPTTRLTELRAQTSWSKEDIIEGIDTLCELYDFPYPTLLKDLARKESKYGQDTRCGDNGKSCYLYQIRPDTWLMFVKTTGRQDLHYDNNIDQIEMTMLALKKGYWYLWGPMLRQYSSNPIKN